MESNEQYADCNGLLIDHDAKVKWKYGNMKKGTVIDFRIIPERSQKKWKTRAQVLVRWPTEQTQWMTYPWKDVWEDPKNLIVIENGIQRAIKRL